ncbi:hypothetical protein OSB04_000858 [Centaurea solstitialis]|uniref:Retroviral polymerase SH3-like domain-containing protein n=1 Tax=Centaurea solstitialis TaxID=347529 RepID=A0AA38WL56_9ASTR|nr:hypothetical protein OSB04_000858 [Centaurea solstitialis]
MVETSETSNQTVDFCVPSSVDVASLHALQITVVKLNGQNYLECAQSVKLALDGRGKIGIIQQSFCVDTPQQNGVAEIKIVPRALVFSNNYLGPLRFISNQDKTKSKLDRKTRQCIFLRYAVSQKGYKCFDPIMKIYFVTMDTVFF